MKFDDLLKFIITVSVVWTFLWLALTDIGLKEALISITSGIIGYWFGSSEGSKKKTDALLKEKE